MISFCAAGVELEQLAMLHLSYESCCACTAIVCTAADGATMMARTLDWELPILQVQFSVSPSLTASYVLTHTLTCTCKWCAQALNVQLRVFRGGNLLYHSTTWAGTLHHAALTVP